VWKSELPLNIKIHSTLHLTNNFVYPFILILAILNLPVILIKKQSLEFEVYYFIFAFFMISFSASFLFYALAQRSLHKDWKKRMLLFPVFMSGSMGFSINNSRAVIEALFKKRTPFIRTPKYQLIGQSGSFFEKHYGISLDKMVFFEILMAVYSCFGVLVAIYHIEIGIIPFMLMFFAGFSFISYLSIKHHLLYKYRRV
jgi:hypothetical protein